MIFVNTSLRKNHKYGVVKGMAVSKQPKVTIIVPAYNTGNYISKCLNSLKEQTLHDIEIVVVVDGATDNTEKIARDFANNDERFKVVVTENKGSASAKNTGIQNSSGSEYLMFIDSDDWIEPESCEELYASAKKNKVDIVTFGYYRVYPDGKSINETKNKVCNKNYFDTKLFKPVDYLGNFISLYGMGVTNKFISVEFINSNGLMFETDHQVHAEDLYFSYSALFCKPLVYVLNKPFYNYYQRSSSALHSDATGIGRRYMQLFERIELKLNEKSPNDEFKPLLSWLFYYMLTFTLYNWYNCELKWLYKEFKPFKNSSLYLKYMYYAKKLTRIENETVNGWFLRKIFATLFTARLKGLAFGTLILRIVLYKRVKSNIKGGK